ncbi:unnamed protein product, partial [Prorocentrum cordatum]
MKMSVDIYSSSIFSHTCLLTYWSLSCLTCLRPFNSMDWLTPSALKRGPAAGEGDQRGKDRRVDKPEDGHVNSKLLRQLESRIGALEFGSGLAVYGPSDAFQITMLKAMYSDYQKQVEGKGAAQQSVKHISEVPDRLLLMMQHSDMPTCSLWIKECGTSNTQDGGISRITVKALGSITFPVEVSQPTPLQEQKQHWEVLGDAGAEQGAKDKGWALGHLLDACAALQGDGRPCGKGRAGGSRWAPTDALGVVEPALASAVGQAVERAIKILREFYTKAEGSFVQEPYKGMQDVKGGVLGLLEVCLSDFARLETETSMAEEEAQSSYEKFMAESTESKEVKEVEKEHKEGNKADAEADLRATKKELSLTQEELDKEPAPPPNAFGMVDIDAELAREVPEVESEGAIFVASHPGAGAADGMASLPGDPADLAEDLREGEAPSRGPPEREAPLSEEEMRLRVRQSIDELVAPGAGAPDGLAASAQELELGGQLTPAQLFYSENRERLVSRAQDYYLEKQRQQLRRSDEVEDIEEEWRFYHEPVVRPPKGHLWSTSTDGEEVGHGLEEGWREAVTAWPKGQLPTPEMLAALLRAEQVYLCCSPDIVSRATLACEAPHVDAFCYGTRNDEWVVAHCGPIKVHLFTRESREQYRLQELWERPDEFFLPGDFPHYVEVLGTAGEAAALPDGHRTYPDGSRSGSGRLPPPFQDRAHDALLLTDYDAADDAQYITPSTGGPRAAVGDFEPLEAEDGAGSIEPQSDGDAWPFEGGLLGGEDETDDEGPGAGAPAPRGEP